MAAEHTAQRSGPAGALRITTVMLAALAMGMKLAHALEMLPKLQWDAALYLSVQTSLYRVFGILGPIFELGALLCVALQSRALHGAPERRFVLVSLGAIALSVADFISFVRPDTQQIAQWSESGMRPSDWERWRFQWQLAQSVSFALHFVSLWALAMSLWHAKREHSPSA